MKKIYSLCLGIFLIFSCSKEDTSTDGETTNPNGENPIALTACFTLDKTTAEVGEYLQITSCSEGVSSYLYDFGNGNTSVKENPKILLEESGELHILLTVKDVDEKTETFTKAITVTAPVEVNYIFPNIAEGSSSYPIEIGLTPDNSIYYLEAAKEGSNVGKLNYQVLDESFEKSTQYLLDQQFNTNSGFINFLSTGNKNLHFSRTLADFYGTHEITFNSTWSYVSGLNSATKHNYGFISNGANFLYFGTKKENDIYKTAIETRNASGDTFAENINAFGDNDAMIGDMIATTNGFVAYGAVFTKNSTAPQITNYKPLLIFFDTDLNITNHVILNSSVLDSKISSANDLNSTYHLAELNNGNLVLYGNAELIVTNASGVVISTSYFDETLNNQALIGIDDTFIISTKNYLRKFDADGNQTKEIKYNGLQTPEIIETNGQLFFVTGYDLEENSSSFSKLFYGAMDTNLNLINLNE